MILRPGIIVVQKKVKGHERQLSQKKSAAKVGNSWGWLLWFARHNIKALVAILDVVVAHAALFYFSVPRRVNICVPSFCSSEEKKPASGNPVKVVSYNCYTACGVCT